MVNVFLGGTCNGSNWRDELIPLLDNNKIEVFNPVVDKWDDKAQAIEDYHKQNDDFCLYVLTPEMIGIYSIFEVAGTKQPDKTLVCMLPERKGKVFPEVIMNNFVKIKKDLINNGFRVFESLEDIANFLNNYKK